MDSCLRRHSSVKKVSEEEIDMTLAEGEKKKAQQI